MAEITIAKIGTIQIKMDTKDDTYFDAKDPHVSFIRNGRPVVKHVFLSEVDNIVGTGDKDLQEAIRYVRKKQRWYNKTIHRK